MDLALLILVIKNNFMKLFLLIILLYSFKFQAQIPFYYKILNVEGVIYDTSKNPIKVKFISRNKLEILNCKDKNIDTLLRSLTLAKKGRKQLRNLLSTSSKITISIFNKVGLMQLDGKYRLIAGLTGVEENQSFELIKNKASISRWNSIFKKNKFLFVYKENTINIYKGSILYGNDSTYKLTNQNTIIYNRDSNEYIKEFSMDTIEIESLMFPDLLYKNAKELYYFAGLHEIFHTTPENIELQEKGGDIEIPAMILEIKAFRKRKKISYNF